MRIDQLERVRQICTTLPETSERLSHGEPTFFVRGKVYVMFAANHHGDGRVAVWLPAPPGAQEALVETTPATFFRPPYVGGRGWLGICLDPIDDEELRLYIETAWELVAPKRLRASRISAGAAGDRAVQPLDAAAPDETVQQLPGGQDTILLRIALPQLRPLEAFRALVEPEVLVRWWPTEAEVELREGGTYCLSWPAQGWRLRGRFLSVVSPERLVYTWRWDHEPDLPERTVAITLTANRLGSVLTLTQGPYGLDEREQADRQSHLDGWRHFLPKLQALAG